MRTIRHQTVNDRHQFGAHFSAVRTETQRLKRDEDAKNEIIYSELSYPRADSRLILRAEQIEPVFSPVSWLVGHGHGPPRCPRKEHRGHLSV